MIRGNTKAIPKPLIGYKDLDPTATYAPYHIELRNGYMDDAGNWVKRNGYIQVADLGVDQPVKLLLNDWKGYAVTEDGTVYYNISDAWDKGLTPIALTIIAPNYIETAPNLRVGSITTRVAHDGFTFYIEGVQYTKAIDTVGIILTAATTKTGKYNATAFDIGTDEEIHVIEAPANTAGYDDANLAVRDLPLVADHHVRMGTLTAMRADADFVLGTTALIQVTTDEGTINTIIAFSDEKIGTVYTATGMNGPNRSTHERFDDKIILCDGGRPIKIEGTSTIGTLGGYPPNAKFCGRVGGYLLLAGYSTHGFRHSSVNNPENFYTGDSNAYNVKKDGYIRYACEFEGKWYVFKDTSIEVWHNRGYPAPFVRLDDASVWEKGIGASYSVVKANNSLYFFGNDGDFYQLVGKHPQVISKSYSSYFNGQLIGMAGEMYGFDCRVENCIRWFSPQNGLCIKYDYLKKVMSEDNMWVGSGWQRLPFNSYAESNGEQYFGSYNHDGLIYRWSSDYKDDNGTAIRTFRDFKIKEDYPSAARWNDIRWSFKPGVIENLVSISNVTWTDAGACALNGLTVAGPYTGETTILYEIQIDAQGTPDTYKWRKDALPYVTGVAITAGAMALDNGLTITIENTTGYDVGDKWTFRATYADSTRFEYRYALDGEPWSDWKSVNLGRLGNYDPFDYTGPLGIGREMRLQISETDPVDFLLQDIFVITRPVGRFAGSGSGTLGTKKKDPTGEPYIYPDMYAVYAINSLPDKFIKVDLGNMVKLAEVVLPAGTNTFQRHATSNFPPYTADTLTLRKAYFAAYNSDKIYDVDIDLNYNILDMTKPSNFAINAGRYLAQVDLSPSGPTAMAYDKSRSAFYAGTHRSPIIWDIDATDYPTALGGDYATNELISDILVSGTYSFTITGGYELQTFEMTANTVFPWTTSQITLQKETSPGSTVWENFAQLLLGGLKQTAKLNVGETYRAVVIINGVGIHTGINLVVHYHTLNTKYLFPWDGVGIGQNEDYHSMSMDNQNRIIASWGTTTGGQPTIQRIDPDTWQWQTEFNQSPVFPYYPTYKADTSRLSIGGGTDDLIHIAIDSDTNIGYFAVHGSKTIYKVDLDTMTEIATVTTSVGDYDIIKTGLLIDHVKKKIITWGGSGVFADSTKLSIIDMITFTEDKTVTSPDATTFNSAGLIDETLRRAWFVETLTPHKIVELDLDLYDWTGRELTLDAGDNPIASGQYF